MRRILLYCHNVEGLGHIARTLRVAEEVSRLDHAHVVIVTGCRFLTQFRRRVANRAALDFHELPWLMAHSDGKLVGENGRSADLVLEERSRGIHAFARKWQPDVFVADHNPAGLCGELWPTLQAAARERWRTKFVWGARDIWSSPDLPAQFIQRIRRHRLEECLQHYSAVMAYSDAHWIDTLAAYERYVRLPPLRCAVGFVTPKMSGQKEANRRPKLVLSMGGGTYGQQVIEIVWRSVGKLVRGGVVDLRIALGPHAAHVAEAPSIDWSEEGVEIATDTPIDVALRGADVSISTAGYGTAYTVIQASCGNILLPVPGDGQEQYFRAMRLATLPGVATHDMATPRGSDDIRRMIETFMSTTIDRNVPFSCNGAVSAAAFLESMLS